MPTRPSEYTTICATSSNGEHWPQSQSVPAACTQSSGFLSPTHKLTCLVRSGADERTAWHTEQPKTPRRYHNTDTNKHESALYCPIMSIQLSFTMQLHELSQHPHPIYVVAWGIPAVPRLAVLIIRSAIKVCNLWKQQQKNNKCI